MAVDSVYRCQPDRGRICGCFRVPSLKNFVHFLKQVAIDRLPKYLLLLISERNSAVMDAPVAKIIYIGDAAFVRHSVPSEEPIVREPLPFDVQIIFERQFEWRHSAPLCEGMGRLSR